MVIFTPHASHMMHLPSDLMEGRHCNSNFRLLGYIIQIERLGEHCKFDGRLRVSVVSQEKNP
jgi:hypothetical protein